MLQKIKDKKILVTGGSGFIGSHLCDKLLENGNIVYNVDNFDPFYGREIKEKNIHEALKHENYTLIETDIRNKNELFNALDEVKDPDVIIHLAAKAGVRPSIEDPEAYVKTNILGTNNMLEYARCQSKLPKFILASSSSIYGNNSKVPFSESDTVNNPISPYASTKRAAELLGYTFHHIYQLPVICLRFFTVYGPRQRPDLAIRKFFDLIHRDEPIELYGDGNSSRDYTYIEDIIDAIIKILDLDFKFEILNLGNNTPINLSLLVKLIEDTMGKNASKKYKELPPGDVQRTWADISKARELINYEPIVKMDEGLKEFYVWYKKYTNI